MHKVQMHDFYSIGHHSENSYSFYTTRVSHRAQYIYIYIIFFKDECSLMQDYLFLLLLCIANIEK